MKNRYFLFDALMILSMLVACKTGVKESVNPFKESWQSQFGEQLQLSGHRNWILIVDKAFPQQPGMHIINTNTKLLPVFEEVLKKIQESTHVRPIIYNDAELQFITDSLAPGVTVFKQKVQKLLSGAIIQPLLHDSVFVRMDKAARLFSVTVLKTEELIPYSSIFIELDCAYWNAEKEKELRTKMKFTNN